MTDTDETWLRQRVIDTALEMSRSGLSPGRSGNVSARSGGHMLITPSGMAYDDLLPGDIVAMGLDGSIAGEQGLPSSEWHFHLAIYRARPNVSGVVHAHSPFATSLACLDRDIPAFHYMVAVAGGSDIRCAPYATFGTAELAEHAVAALVGRKACLLSHHGQIAVGESVEKALELAHEVEMLAEHYWRVLQIGKPKILDEAEMARVLRKFETYGAAL